MQEPNIVPDSNIPPEPNIEPGMTISPLNETLTETPDDLFHTIRDWLNIQYSPNETLNYFTSVGIVLGVTFDPMRDECFHAVRGGGAYVNGKRIRVSRISKKNRTLLGTGFPFRAARMAAAASL